MAGSTNAPLNPLLGPLTNNGGPTLTMALLPGSPAIDAGDDGLLSAPYNLTTDQRGLPRKAGAHVDIGALEFQVPTSTPIYLTSPAPLANGALQLAFTNVPYSTSRVWASTDLSPPSSNWTVLGQAFEVAPGEFQFTDPQTTNNPQRFYRVSSP